MDNKIEAIIKNWKERNIIGVYSEDKITAAQKIMELIPLSASVGFSGSQTLVQLGILDSLESRGNQVFNQNRQGITREESLELRKLGAQADFYLSSPNAISENGELVFFSAFGNRTAGVAYAKNSLVVAGINKIVPNLEQALKRAREYATPLNCKRLKWETPCARDGICYEESCRFPGYKRMCCQVLIIEAEALLGRFKVFLVGEKLGY